MSEVLAKISSFITNGLSFLGIFGTENWSYEAVLGEATQVVMQIIATILLFIFIRIFIWKRIMNILEARQNNIEKNIKDAEELKALAAQKESLVAAEYEKAKQMAKEIIDKAELEGKEEKDKIILSAKEEAKRRMGLLEDELKREEEKNKENVKNAITDIAFLVAEKIVKHEIDKKEYANIVTDFIEEVGK